MTPEDAKIPSAAVELTEEQRLDLNLQRAKETCENAEDLQSASAEILIRARAARRMNHV
ncbi:MAG: hypothetical protein AAF409_05510 [Pseudomonadota bacterium]